MTQFNEAEYNTPNPAWTKEKCKNKFDLQKLADHICTRTPPKSYASKTALYTAIVQRNQKALGSWGKGYLILTGMVEERLTARDTEPFAPKKYTADFKIFLSVDFVDNQVDVLADQAHEALLSLMPSELHHKMDIDGETPIELAHDG